MFASCTDFSDDDDMTVGRVPSNALLAASTVTNEVEANRDEGTGPDS